MNPLLSLTKILARFFAIALLLSYALKWFFAEGTLPAFYENHRLAITFLLVSTVGLADLIYIYPFYRSPLRNLPSVKSTRTFGDLVLDNPRGSTPLQWMKAHPTAELIRGFGPLRSPMLVASGAAALRDILHSRCYDFAKSWGVRAMLARVLGFGLILTEGEQHRRQRRVLQPCFNIRKIHQLYGLMWEKTGILLEQVERDGRAHPELGELGGLGMGEEEEKKKEGTWGKVEMAEWTSRLTLDIIGPTAMGRDFQSLTHMENPIAAAFLEILDPRPERLFFFSLHFVIPEWLIRRLPWSINTMIDTNCGMLRDTCDQIVREKRAEMLQSALSAKEKPAGGGDGIETAESGGGGDVVGGARNQYDILSTIMETGQFGHEETIDQMLTFLAAGHETTASALAWVCFLCAKHPEIQARLRAEIRAALPLGPAGDVDPAVVNAMPLLHGVCEEAQRLYPTVPATVREAIVDTTVAGQAIPRGTLIVILPYAINRHPRYWGADAEAFRPERWIDAVQDGPTGTSTVPKPNKHGGATGSNYAEMTFLHGPRSCIGRDFAKAELRCAVAGLVGRFEFMLPWAGYEPEAHGVITTKPRGGMHLCVRRVGGW